MTDSAASRSPITPGPIGIIGRGRAANALVPMWQAAGHEIAFWRSRADGPNTAAPACKTLILAIPDDQLVQVARELATRPSAKDELWIHLSGATPISRLRIADDVPRMVGGLHPLVALARDATLAGAVAGIEAETPAGLGICRRLAMDADLEPLALDAAQPHARALYHAAAVTVAGHATALFAQAIELMTGAGLSPDFARAALQPLLLSAARNLEAGPPSAVITGPICRGDIGTVERHLEAIDRCASDSPGFSDIAATYRLLGKMALSLCRDRLARDTAQSLDAILGP